MLTGDSTDESTDLLIKRSMPDAVPANTENTFDELPADFLSEPHVLLFSPLLLVD